MPAVGFALVTPELHVVPAGLLERGQVPASTKVEKLFWSDDVDKLMHEFQGVKELGLAAAEEWIKGLETRGTKSRHDTWRWEKYASSGGVGQMRTLLYPGYQQKQLSQPVAAAPTASGPVAEPGLGFPQGASDAVAPSAPVANPLPGALRSLTST